MKIHIQFWSYFRDLTGCAETTIELPNGSSLGELHRQACEDFPKLEKMRNSTLIAVGMDYQEPDYELQEGDKVSFFPPVQGG